MVKTTGPYPLFWYIFSPGARRSRRKNNAETGPQGFNVALYSDSTLVYCRYDDNNQLVERSIFQLPPEAADRYTMILQSETWWLRTLPLNIRSSQQTPEYSCMFGFAGHPMFCCDELHKMVLLSDANRDGVHARRLHVMMEFIAEMLYEYGVLLQLDQFRWDWQSIQPLTPEQAAMYQRSLAEPAETPEDEQFRMAQ